MTLSKDSNKDGLCLGIPQLHTVVAFKDLCFSILVFLGTASLVPCILLYFRTVHPTRDARISHCPTAPS